MYIPWCDAYSAPAIHHYCSFVTPEVAFAPPGSPFLAGEDRVLGGVIVLRCCRCVEAPSSQNIQGILGESVSFFSSDNSLFHLLGSAKI